MTENTSYRLLSAGFFLLLLGLLTGFTMPLLANPRMGLSSHLQGITNGLLLIALGLCWGRLTLSRWQAMLVQVLALVWDLCQLAGDLAGSDLGGRRHDAAGGGGVCRVTQAGTAGQPVVDEPVRGHGAGVVAGALGVASRCAPKQGKKGVTFPTTGARWGTSVDQISSRSFVAVT